TIIRRLKPDQELFDPRDIFYFRERKFYLEIVSGQGPRLTALPGLISKLLAEPIPVKNKAAMTAFFVFASVLPNDRGKALLGYRLKTGQRTTLGFAKEIIGCRIPLRS